MTDPDGDVCRTMMVDGEPVMFHGADGPMSDRAREAFTAVVRAARDQHARDHADDPTFMSAVAEAVHAEAEKRGLHGFQIAAELGVRHSTVVRLMQQSAYLTVGELDRFARWAGLEITAAPKGER